MTLLPMCYGLFSLFQNQEPQNIQELYTICDGEAMRQTDGLESSEVV